MADRQEPPRRNALLSLEELNRIVLEFLNKKGYARTEAMLRLESSRAFTQGSGSATGVSTGIMPLLPTPNSPEMYSRAYLALKEWVESSLDLYQPELARVLYPVFVHLYLELLKQNYLDYAQDFFDKFSESHLVLHKSEIDTLAGLNLPQHVEENETAQLFLQRKYKVLMSHTSLDLLLSFLHSIESIGGIIMVHVINDHVDVEITPTQTLNAPSAGLLPGDGPNGSVTAYNSQSVRLGRMPLEPEFQQEVTAMLEQKDKTEKNDPPLATVFADSTAAETDSPAVESLPLPKYRPADVQATIKKLVDSQNRIKLGVAQAPLPSVCMYTFHNTHDEMNCLAFNDDATLVAGGFSDSFVQLWSLKGDKLSSMIKEENAGVSPSSTRRLIGHAGSVFGVSFAPDNRTLLSCSEDQTVRLWSLDTYTALAAYKGHSEPIWDVKYGPFGHYFATASHDQTARLWSCDHINPLRVFAGHMSDVDNICWHPNGTYLFTGSTDKTLRMWDISRGQSVRVFIGHSGSITATAVSPDGRWLASAGEDSVIHLWDIGSGRRLKTMRGHGRMSIYSLAFSQEGSVLVSGSADNSVRVWDVKKNTPETGSEPEPYESQIPAKLGAEQRKRKDIQASSDQMAVFYTKRTPVYNVQFTSRNLVLAGGAFLS
ncbi:Transcription initiation factor TFIID subunit 5 [Wickerhamiella sorbophila]|uniref:Transcription initiation factor TFIID subunit 5 n=1 Tax=Wickerhamiella sorbophila TaxID=45607 RepID=A0A2T0FD69_9ASCO|nr:Transcription initiation factor TFIID subunit 5 [Wickerhamiella sorbophila]PRT52946.1 Transcription initiation factor TFIID subunit 5 [Wickerhamiella sorbophila]